MAYLLRPDRSSTVTKSGSIVRPDSPADGTTPSSDRFEVVGHQRNWRLAVVNSQSRRLVGHWPLARYRYGRRVSDRGKAAETASLLCRVTTSNSTGRLLGRYGIRLGHLESGRVECHPAQPGWSTCLSVYGRCRSGGGDTHRCQFASQLSAVAVHNRPAAVSV